MKLQRTLPWSGLGLLCAVVAFVFLGSYLRRDTARQDRPLTSAQLVSAIVSLPIIGTTEQKPTSTVWNRYISLAKEMKAAPPETVRLALAESYLKEKRDPRAGIREMILLRVCFECRSDASRKSGGGGW